LNPPYSTSEIQNRLNVTGIIFLFYVNDVIVFLYIEFN